MFSQLTHDSLDMNAQIIKIGGRNFWVGTHEVWTYTILNAWKSRQMVFWTHDNLEMNFWNARKSGQERIDYQIFKLERTKIWTYAILNARKSGHMVFWTHGNMDKTHKLSILEPTKVWTYAILNARKSGHTQFWTHESLDMGLLNALWTHEKFWMHESLDLGTIRHLDLGIKTIFNQQDIFFTSAWWHSLFQA